MNIIKTYKGNTIKTKTIPQLQTEHGNLTKEPNEKEKLIRNALGSSVVRRNKVALFHFAIHDFEQRNDAAVLIKPRVKQQHLRRLGL